MDKKMTVKEFVNKYNTLQNDKLKEDFLKSIVKNNYMPLENKVTLCEKIIESSYYIKFKDKNNIERKKLHVNSISKYMLYCLNIVNNYTTIIIDFKKSLEEFNILNGTGCLDVIFKYVPNREVEEFRKILDMVGSDLIQNEYESHAFISNQVERFADLAGATLSPLLNMLVEKVENLDEKKIDNIVNILNKNMSGK